MHTQRILLLPIAVMLTLMAIGCDEKENNRLVDMAEKHLERQAEQNRQTIELQRQVAEGSRQLVEADAQARKEIVALQRDIQAERTEVGQQRDVLEDERRDLATIRRTDPIIAAAITNAGLLAACLLPLVLCWYLLRRPMEPADDQAVAELLLEDLVIDQPLLLATRENQRALPHRKHDDSLHLPGASDETDQSV